MKLNRKLKMGMVGGGPGAFIGDVHRKASRIRKRRMPCTKEVRNLSRPASTAGGRY